jgi:hypothetical protein
MTYDKRVRIQRVRDAPENHHKRRRGVMFAGILFLVLFENDDFEDKHMPRVYGSGRCRKLLIASPSVILDVISSRPVFFGEEVTH